MAIQNSRSDHCSVFIGWLAETPAPARVHLHTVQAPLPSDELQNEMPEVIWTQTCPQCQLSREHAAGQGCESRTRWPGGHYGKSQHRTQAEFSCPHLQHRITGTAPALPSHPRFLYLPHLQERESDLPLNNMVHISVVGFQSLNYCNVSGHAMKLSCCLKVSCHRGGHLHITCEELKALLLLRHDKTDLLWRICITQNTTLAVAYS